MPKQNQLPALPDTNSITVIDQPTLDAASTVLVGLKRLRKEIENHYDNLIKPIDKVLKDKKHERDNKLAELDSRIVGVSTRINGYIAAESARRLEATKANNQAAQKVEAKERTKEIKALIKEGKVEEALELKAAPSTAIAEYVEPVRAGVEQVSTSSLLDFKVEDESKIPNMYFKPRELDTKAIRAAGHAGKTISGIRFFRKQGLVVRA